MAFSNNNETDIMEKLNKIQTRIKNKAFGKVKYKKVIKNNSKIDNLFTQLQNIDNNDNIIETKTNFYGDF